MRIAISPDENPGDTGSIAADGTTERSVNLKVAAALQAVLIRCGQDAWFDPTITYVDRVAKANADGTSVLFACAHNESTIGLSGTQFVFATGGQSYDKQGFAADAVYAELIKIPGWPARKPDAVEAIYECWAFNGNTIYCEFLYMSSNDEVLWNKPEYPSMAAEAAARGLAHTFGFAYVPVVLPTVEENMIVKASRPDGGFDYFALISNTAWHYWTSADGTVGGRDKLPGVWLTLVEAGWHSNTNAYLRGFGTDYKVYETDWKSGDLVWEAPIALTS